MPGCTYLFSRLRIWRRPASKSEVEFEKNGQLSAINQLEGSLKSISSLAEPIMDLTTRTASSELANACNSTTVQHDGNGVDASIAAGSAPTSDDRTKVQNLPTAFTEEKRTGGLQQLNVSGHVDGSGTITFELLPNELQREIFIFTTSLFREESHAPLSSIASLMLVAQCFYDWVLPCLYDTVTLHTDNTLFLRTIQSYHDSPTFFTKYIKKLCLPYYMISKDAELVLSLCDNVVDLAFWIDYRTTVPDRSIVPLLSSLPLRRLNIEARHFESLFVDVHQLGWLHSLTHLSLVYWDFQRPSEVLHLEKLPSLTHLALSLHDNRLPATSLVEILSACKQIKVLALYGQKEPPEESGWAVDSRAVFITYSSEVVREWEVQANNLQGCGWKKAELLAKSSHD
ncbi:hypothetical protein CPB83DRAFT_183558 [Crepidotus variabilis]|uniref:F-box domain-containing protein n=1 Tax=Crepidotus variabilis TaxID=179855 RepID=A0A9P6EIV2_9AGAR|nr:hypothetical protein CPB83DRAFT_183558 [Crepidotus variabilis]